MKIQGVEVTVKNLSDYDDTELSSYIDYVNTKTGKTGKMPSSLEVRGLSNGDVTLYYTINGVKFERIRRITGYLVGTIDRWNNAKKSEERERVKHL